MTKINKEGWEIKKLGEVCDFQGGSQPPKNEWTKEPHEGYVRMLQIRDFTQSATDYIEYVKITKSIKQCKSDDILIGRYGASVGKILTGLEGAYNVAIIKSIPDENLVLKRYIRHYFESSYFQSGLLHVSKMRAAQQGFSKEDIVDFVFPLPPLPIQQRIVEELDEINAIISAKKEQLSKLDELAQSIFYNMFGDPIANEKGWEVKKLGEVAEVQNGFAFKSDLFTESGLPILRISNIQNNGITEEGCVFFEESSYNTDLSRYVVEPNRILIAMSGATTGKCGINKTNTCFYLNQRVGMFKENKEIIETMYLFHFLSMKSEESLKLAMGVAQPNLSTSQIKDFDIPLPPLPLQEAFAARVSATEEEKAAIAASIEKMQTLLDARMQEYFG